MIRWWTTVFAETDVPNPIDGGYCWCHAKVRPAWYWLWRRVCLFFLIAWRRVDTMYPDRLDWRTAWKVTGIVSKGLTRKDVRP